VAWLLVGWEWSKQSPPSRGIGQRRVLVRTLTTHPAHNFLDNLMSLWYSVSNLIQPSGTGAKHTPCPPKHITSPPKPLHPRSPKPALLPRSCTLPTARSKPIPFPFNHFRTLPLPVRIVLYKNQAHLLSSQSLPPPYTKTPGCHPLCFPNPSTITLTPAPAHGIGCDLFTVHATRSTTHAPVTPLSATLTKNRGRGSHVD
jgi:hypothetical protein